MTRALQAQRASRHGLSSALGGLGRRALALLMTLALGLALSVGVAAIQPHPTAAATAAAETPASADTGNAGSFRLGTVRILGVPALTVVPPL